MTTRCGCLEELPTECNCTVEGSDSIDVVGDGWAGDPYEPSVEIDPTTGNLISCGSGGLYAAIPARILTPPRARLFATYGLVTNGAGGQVMDWEGAYYDNASPLIWDATDPSKLTAPIDGLYGCGAAFCFDLTGFALTDDWRMILRQNGTTSFAGKTRRVEGNVMDGQRVFDRMCVYEEYPFSEGDYFELLVRQTSAGSQSSYPTLPAAPVAYMTFLGDL